VTRFSLQSFSWGSLNKVDSLFYQRVRIERYVCYEKYDSSSVVILNSLWSVGFKTKGGVLVIFFSEIF